MESTFVFKEIAHARPPGQDKLRDIFDDFGFVFWRESSEPFGQSLGVEMCGQHKFLVTWVGDRKHGVWGNIQLCPVWRAE
jgi:hypothetical protein